MIVIGKTVQRMRRLPIFLLRKAVLRALALLTLAGGALCAQEYSFRSFGIAEGLKNLAILQIYQDRVGFIWVSTQDGIFRYDGDRFEAFATEQGIPSNSGMTFGEAPDGSLLAGGDIGLYRLSGNHFEKLPPISTPSPRLRAFNRMGRATPILAPTSGLWNCIRNPARINSACGGFLSRREHPGRPPMGFSWMATPSGMAADYNSAAWMPPVLASLDMKADFRTGSCRASRKTGLEISGCGRGMRAFLNGPPARPDSRGQVSLFTAKHQWNSRSG